MAVRRSIPPESVNAARAVATWIVRAAAVVCLAVGAYLFLKRVFFGAGTGDLAAPFTVYMEDGDRQSVYRGLAMMVVGGVLAGVSRRLARWVVVIPAMGCPRCGYPSRSADGRCPECGLAGFEPEGQGPAEA